MSTDNTYTNQPSYTNRADERRRRVPYLRIPPTSGFGLDEVSNHPFSGMLIASTAKGYLGSLRRSRRSRYAPHVGTKQQAKASKRQLAAA